MEDVTGIFKVRYEVEKPGKPRHGADMEKEGKERGH